MKEVRRATSRSHGGRMLRERKKKTKERTVCSKLFKVKSEQSHGERSERRFLEPCECIAETVGTLKFPRIFMGIFCIATSFDLRSQPFRISYGVCL